MQLKIRRSQKEQGMMGKTVVFCLDARAQLTPAEQDSVKRYKLGGQVIYNSEAAKRQIAKGDEAYDGSATGSLKALGAFALAALQLNITINSLQQGQHIECKSLEEVMAAEEALVLACQNLKTYLGTAARFDGREVVIDFNDEAQARAITGKDVVPPVAPAQGSAPTALLPPEKPQNLDPLF